MAGYRNGHTIADEFISNVKFMSYREVIDCENALEKAKATMVGEMKFSLDELKGKSNLIQVATNNIQTVSGVRYIPDGMNSNLRDDCGHDSLPENVFDAFREIGLGDRKYRFKELQGLIGNEVKTAEMIYTLMEALNELRAGCAAESGHGYWWFNL